jgi:hypothetical protein
MPLTVDRPQWKPAVDRGSTQGRVCLLIKRVEAATEPAVERPEHVNRLTALVPIRVSP